MKTYIVALITAFATSTAFGQVGMPLPGQYIELKRAQQDAALAAAMPDYGYVVYGSDGAAIKAFGPETPISVDQQGNVTITGAELPPGATVITEDGPTFFQALGSVGANTSPEVDTEITRTLRDVVDSISEGAEYVATTLCPHPARPTKITVAIEGGFNFYVHGSVVSTVDWDLEAMCGDEDLLP